MKYSRQLSIHPFTENNAQHGKEKVTFFSKIYMPCNSSCLLINYYVSYGGSKNFRLTISFSSYTD